MRETISIIETKIKRSKNGGEYMSIDAVEGRYTCWIPMLFEYLTKGEIEVEILEKNGFKNIVGAGDIIPDIKTSKKYFPKEDRIALAQENKMRGIEMAQDRKNDAMRIMGSVRDSVLIVTAKMKWEQMSDEQIKEELRKWKQEINELYY